MHKDFLPPVSIEEFAAYLDGNLTQEETLKIDNLVSSDNNMDAIRQTLCQVDNDVDLFYESDCPLPEEIANWDFELPDVGNPSSFQLPFGMEEPNASVCPSFMDASDDCSHEAFQPEDDSPLRSVDDCMEGHSGVPEEPIGTNDNTDITEEF